MSGDKVTLDYEQIQRTRNIVTDSIFMKSATNIGAAFIVTGVSSVLAIYAPPFENVKQALIIAPALLATVAGSVFIGRRIRQIIADYQMDDAGKKKLTTDFSLVNIMSLATGMFAALPISIAPLVILGGRPETMEFFAPLSPASVMKICAAGVCASLAGTVYYARRLKRNFNNLTAPRDYKPS